MRVKRRAEIPELDDFDQHEFSTNPVLNASRPVPLIGALLIAEGLITQEQLNACLLLQEQDHPDKTIGQILLQSGYISQTMLDHVVGLQHELTSSLVDLIESHELPPADLRTVVLHARGDELASSVLSRLGVAVTTVRDRHELAKSLTESQFDMILIGAELLDDTASLPDNGETPLLVLPPLPGAAGRFGSAPQWFKTLIARFLVDVRARQRQREMHERLYQREYEVNTIAAMCRSIAFARSGHDALAHLMSTIRDLFGVEAGTLYRYDRAAAELIFEVVLGPYQEKLYQQRLPADRGLAGWVVRNGEPLLIPDVRRDSRFEGMFDHRSGFQTRSVLCVPIIVKGEVRGVIQLLNKVNGDFNERDLLLLRILAAMGGVLETADSQLHERNLGT